MQKGKMGRIYRRVNSNHEFGSANEHNWLRLEDEDGRHERWIRFSDADLARMEESAAKNAEDAPEVGFMTNLLD